MTGYSFPYSPLQAVGAEIDFDLSHPLNDADQGRLRALLYERGLLLFRNQSLTDEDQCRVLGYFGHVLFEEGGHREISVDGNLGSGRLLFHSDLAFTPEPFKLLSLYGIAVEAGAETMFASGTMVLEALPAEVRRRLGELRATTTIPPSQSERLVTYESPAFVPQITRPAIISHPVTGKPVLFISEQQTSRFERLTQADSDALLEETFRHFYAASNVYRHKWRAGDLLVWDNIATQHARPDQSYINERRLRRVAVADKTFFQLCPQFPPDDPRIAVWGRGGKLILA